MANSLLTPISTILIVGVLGQWVAWLFKLPSIFILLIAGIILGPATGILDPDAIFGETLFPLVSISVGIILFEGGLTLKLSELRSFGPLIRNLCTISALVTCALSTLFAFLILQFNFSLSLLVGAILIVTGPTVIIPLLRHIKASNKLSMALRWEGIVTDPIGAVLAVLVFETIAMGGISNLPSVTIIGILKTITVGIIFGWAFYRILLYLLEQHLIPEFLSNSVILIFVVLSFTLSHLVQSESGLLTTTLMGFLFANQNKVSVTKVIEFKENLRVLIIGTLFILLASRLELGTISLVGIPGILFLFCLIFLVRPISVFVATFGMSDVSLREKLFLSFVCPRGVVAAAVSSLFSLKLMEMKVPDAEKLGVTIFIVILGTVTFYGLFSRTIAKLLNVTMDESQGVLIVGAQRWARVLAKNIKDRGYPVMLIDTNRSNCDKAIQEGLPCILGNILDDDILSEINLDGIDKLLALTANDEVNTLACVAYSRIFTPEKVYKVRPDQASVNSKSNSLELEGHPLFSENCNFSVLQRMLQSQDVLSVKTPADSSERSVLFGISKNNRLVFSIGQKTSPADLKEIIYLSA